MKIKLLSLITLIGASSIAFAQTTFSPKITIDADTGDNPYTIATGLINNDAFLDIVVGTDTDNELLVYLNNGDATFTKQPNIPNTISAVGGLKLVDLNNDTFLDLLVTAYTSDSVTWYANDGSGNFGVEQSIATVNGASGLFVGDVDGNLTPDVVVTSYDDNQVLWFSNDGAGNFTTPATSLIDNTLVAPGAVNMSDIDGDGDLDALVATAAYSGDVLEIFRNDLVPGGTVDFIKDATSVATGKIGFFNATFEDLDGDANLDILATEIKFGAMTGNFYWYEDNGAGFTETAFVTSIMNPSVAQHRDLDGDNLKDIILSSGTSNAGNDIVWYKNNGGTYGSEQVIDDTSSQAFVYNIADYDNDGDLDIASCEYNQDNLNLFKNNFIVLSTDDTNLEVATIYPNPAKDVLFFKGMTSETLNLEVYDILGKVVIQTSIEQNGSLDISELKNGMYILKFETSDATFKFVKE
ncbi:T9SS type A sorting domain-containing protein [Psychroserpens algicola]|uniref:T9SS type A sorting domain-containing protein n=1 Tax=Psychroserpens algicola TaxID=1719034 RepID=A0ABT0H8M5_9FLAO|nr:T9SS type A sorting domain-containing protein [Psychroserpens algicola]MCK8480726.1 T9SS type A sorting domain-containing protein [Psychroserpens algicola]